MKNILVTWWAWYIWSHTVKLLLKKWLNPIVFDNLETWFKKLLLTDSFYKWDLRKIEDLENVFKNEKIDAVIHFAAYASVPLSMNDPEDYYENNILWSMNLLNVMRKYWVNKMIFSSSAAVYWEPETEIIKEDHPKNPTNPYWHSKLMFEEILAWYNKAYDFSSISFRYFCAAWSTSDLDIGELHSPETHVIPVAIHTSLWIRDKFIIYWDDYNTPDGTCIRDFIHVDDLAEAHILWLDHLEKNNCKQFNLWIWKWFSVKEIVDSVKKVSWVDFKVEIWKRRQGDPSVLIADSAQAKQYLNWEPKFLNIDDIVGSAFMYLKKHYEN